jgi:hypothetical protein
METNQRLKREGKDFFKQLTTAVHWLLAAVHAIKMATAKLWP